MKNEVCRVLSAIFSAARYQDMRRLPELFCGFKRRIHLGPTPYPVACAPQAWAAASVFGLLQACLGLQFLYSTQEIVLQEPLIPDFLDELTIGNLRLGNSRVDLHLHRYANDVTVSITGRVGDAKVILVK
jgi:glycogen debranching enzyme